MAAAVMQPLSALPLSSPVEIMAPSPISPLGTARHGRRGSYAKKGRGRGHSIVEERESLISKALTRVLKRAAEAGEANEGHDVKLTADAEGWVSCQDLLTHPTLDAFQVTLHEIQSLVLSPNSKSRFVLKSTSSEDAEDASLYALRLNAAPAAVPTTDPASTATLTPLTTTSENVPNLIIYDTSYANYPLILASGALRRAGGQTHLLFSSIRISADGSENRVSSTKDDADVSIYLDLPALLASTPSLKWFLNEQGMVVTAGNSEGLIEKSLWKKVVARRADIGVLFMDGEVRKEIPIGLRGKGALKGKRGGGKGRGLVKKELKDDKARSDESAESAEEADE